MNQARLLFIFSFIFFVLCGFVGLVVDYGNMVRVRAEVQRTADAAALAGATGLIPYTSTGPNSNAKLGEWRD